MAAAFDRFIDKHGKLLAGNSNGQPQNNWPLSKAHAEGGISTILKALIGQSVCNATVTINTCRTGFQRGMRPLRGRRLPLRAHRLGRMTVTTLSRIGCLHSRPDILRERRSMLLEFLRRVQSTQQMI